MAFHKENLSLTLALILHLKQGRHAQWTHHSAKSCPISVQNQLAAEINFSWKKSDFDPLIERRRHRVKEKNKHAVYA